MRLKIKDIADITIGYQHRGDTLSLSSTGSHRLLQIKDIDREEQFIEKYEVPAKHRLWLDDLYQVTPTAKYDTYAVKEGDVLFLSRGSRYFAVPMVRPYVEPFPASWDNLIAAYYFYILRLQRDDILPEYLAWSLNGERTQADMEAISQGSHMKMIAKGDFSHLAIDVPPIQTQRSIMALDHLALKESRLLEQIKQKRTAMVDSLCRQAATGNN